MKEKNISGRQIRIARFMHQPPLSQADLLARLQLLGWLISQPTLSRIESSKRAVSDIELIMIANALNIDVKWLLRQQ